MTALRTTMTPLARIVAYALPAVLAVCLPACSSSSSSQGGSCDDMTSKAAALVSAARTNDLSCVTDDDCTYFVESPTCTAGCGGTLANRAGAAALHAAVSQANASACAGFKDQGCSVLEPPCAALPGAGLAACIDKTCKSFPPAAWTSFAVEEASSDVVSTPPSCSGVGCRLWTLTPDAKVQVTDANGVHTATLSAADFATVDGVLRGVAFRQSWFEASSCAAPPGASGTFVAFDVSWGTLTMGQDRTACAAGASANDSRTLYEVIKTY
jgi:hypothetical protein